MCVLIQQRKKNNQVIQYTHTNTSVYDGVYRCRTWIVRDCEWEHEIPSTILVIVVVHSPFASFAFLICHEKSIARNVKAMKRPRKKIKMYRSSVQSVLIFMTKLTHIHKREKKESNQFFVAIKPSAIHYIILRCI